MVVEESAASFAPLMGAARQELVLDGAERVVITGDAFRLRQVVDNLLGNAAKYTEGGGRITVRLVESDGHAEVTVADTGIGISEDELPRLFEPYFRADSAVRGGIPGTGLGMGIARDIVVAHGGVILVSSEVDVGTTVTVRFPDERKRTPYDTARARERRCHHEHGGGGDRAHRGRRRSRDPRPTEQGDHRLGVAFGIGMLGAYLWLAGHHTGSPVLRAAASAIVVCFVPLVWIGVRMHFERTAPWLPVIVALVGVPAALILTAGTRWYLPVFHVVFLAMAVFAGLLAWELTRGQAATRDIVLPLALAACGFVVVAVVSAGSALVSGA